MSPTQFSGQFCPHINRYNHFHKQTHGQLKYKHKHLYTRISMKAFLSWWSFLWLCDVWIKPLCISVNHVQNDRVKEQHCPWFSLTWCVTFSLSASVFNKFAQNNWGKSLNYWKCTRCHVVNVYAVIFNHSTVQNQLFCLYHVYPMHLSQE